MPGRRDRAAVLGYGAYVPHHRLRRCDLVPAARPGTGSRAVASFDEDATSMAVEAARAVLRATDCRPRRLYFATACPPYLDKTNATVIHAALGLDDDVLAVDMLGSVRSTVGALAAATDCSEPTLVVMSDVRFGPSGGAEERDCGDAAAALLIGPSAIAPPIAEVLAQDSRSREFLDRWRLPGAVGSRTWEDRFGEHVQRTLAADAFTGALSRVGIGVAAIDHLVVVGLHARAVAAFVRSSGVRPEAVCADLSAEIGNTGAAAPGVALADVLDRALPGEVIGLVVIADGASAVLLRAGEQIAAHRPALSVDRQVFAGRPGLPYTTYLRWRGLLEADVPRRPDPASPAPPAANRLLAYKAGFVGTRCVAPTAAGGGPCNAVHLPPSRVCVACGTLDRMEAAPLAGTVGTIRNFTIDHLVHSLHPPTASAVLELDGGGRCTVDLTDVDPADVAIGDRIELTFRKLHSAGGIHNYFWKGRPVRIESMQEKDDGHTRAS